MKKFADENGNLKKMTESFPEKKKTLEKGEIARFPQCFQKTCTADTKKKGFFEKRLNVVHVGKLV